MSRGALALTLVVAACCGAHQTAGSSNDDRGAPVLIRPPVEIERFVGELPAVLADATWRKRGWGDAIYATASADGTVIAVQFNAEPPGQVAVIPTGGGVAQVEHQPGNVLAAAPPMVGHAAAGAAQVEIREFVTGATYQAPVRVTSADAGGPPSELAGACCGWWERTRWRASSAYPEAGLLRAIDAGDWAQLDWYRSGSSTPSWRVTIPDTIADALVSADGHLAIVQRTVPRGRAHLAAYRTTDGTVAWEVETGPTLHDEGALVAAGNDAVLTVLADPAACEVCQRVEVRALRTGALLHEVAIERPGILGRFGSRGVEWSLGAGEIELWARYFARGEGADSMRARACTFDAYDLQTGAHRVAAEPWRAMFDDCAEAAMIAPVGAGLVAVRPIDERRFEVIRMNRAP